MSGGRSRGGGHRAGTSRQRLKGLFADGIWQCDCTPRLPAEHFRVKKEGKNHGRWFYTCQKGEDQRCGFFLWDDDAKIREEGAVLNNARTEPRSTAHAADSRHDAVHEQPLITGRETQVRSPPPGYSIRDPAPSVSGSRGALADRSDDQDDYGGSWSLNGSDLQRLESDANQHQRNVGMQAPRTPIKRTYADMNDTGLVTPQTDARRQITHGNGEGASSKRRATDADFLDLVSPTTTPTPARFRDALTASGEDPLFAEIKQALAAHRVNMHADALSSIKDICSRSSLRMQGVVKGRDISRLALKAKDAKIVELSRRADTLEAELETERAIVRHLRSEQEAHLR